MPTLGTILCLPPMCPDWTCALIAAAMAAGEDGAAGGEAAVLMTSPVGSGSPEAVEVVKEAEAVVEVNQHRDPRGISISTRTIL